MAFPTYCHQWTVRFKFIKIKLFYDIYFKTISLDYFYWYFLLQILQGILSQTMQQ